jgi:tripartite-type tricarboxylate transporter receptor subunit TctC
MKRRLILASTLAAACSLHAGVALAADAYPQPGKVIKFVVPYPPGGPTDLMARILAPELQKRLGTPVIVDNRAGAGGNLGTDQVAKSAPDGYTILLAASGPMAVNASLYKSMPYNPIKDLAPVIQISAFPLVLEVPASSPVRDLKTLVAAAQARPENFSFASAGNGTPQHLAGELFNRRIDAKMQHIAYKGAGPALNDVLGGQVPLMFDILASSLQNISAGKLRPIAVTTARRSPALPDVPTLAELGMTGFDFSAWHGIAVTAATPRHIVTKLNATLNAIFADPSVKKRWEEIGSPVVGGTPEQFGSLVLTESVRLGRLVKESGATLD